MLKRHSYFPEEYRAALTSILFVAFFATAAWAEPIQFSNEKPVVQQVTNEQGRLAPRMSLSSKLFPAYRPADAISARDINPVSSAPMRPPATRAPVSRRNEELLDRQKNWMFLTPGDDKKMSGDDEVFGFEEATLGERKGAVMRFLEGRNDTGKNDGGQNEGTEKKEGVLLGFDSGKPVTGFGVGSERPENGDQAPLDRNKLFYQEQRQEVLNGVTGERARMDSFWRENYGADAVKARQDKQSQMRDFQGLFSSQKQAAPVGGLYNLENSLSSANGNNLTGNRLATPILPTSSDRFLPTLTGAGGINSTLKSSIGSRLSGASVIPVPAPEALKPLAQPAVLPIPKRRF